MGGLFRLIKGLFTLIGLATVAGGGYLYLWIDRLDPELRGLAGDIVDLRGAADGFDPGAAKVYLGIARTILRSGNPAEAFVWKLPVKEGLSPLDVEHAIAAAADELDISNLDELPLSKEVEAKSGESYRFVKIYRFYKALTAKAMLEYSDAYSAYLPGRIALIQDQQGKLWLYTADMDPMIYGGKPLPPALKEEALKMKELVMNVMARAAGGS